MLFHDFSLIFKKMLKLFYFHLLMISLIKKHVIESFFLRQLRSYKGILKWSKFIKGMKSLIMFINSTTQTVNGPWVDLWENMFVWLKSSLEACGPALPSCVPPSCLSGTAVTLHITRMEWYSKEGQDAFSTKVWASSGKALNQTSWGNLACRRKGLRPPSITSSNLQTSLPAMATAQMTM